MSTPEKIYFGNSLPGPHEGPMNAGDYVPLIREHLERVTKERDEAVRYRESLPANWFEDSSLETWFPYTSKELVRLRAQLATCREALALAGNRLHRCAIEIHGDSPGRSSEWSDWAQEAREALAATGPDHIADAGKMVPSRSTEKVRTGDFGTFAGQITGFDLCKDGLHVTVNTGPFPVKAVEAHKASEADSVVECREHKATHCPACNAKFASGLRKIAECLEMQPMTPEEGPRFDEFFWDEIGASVSPMVFGLEAQGHAPYIHAALIRGKTWDQIAKKVGWDKNTLAEHWDRYLERKKAKQPADCQDKADCWHAPDEGRRCRNCNEALTNHIDQRFCPTVPAQDKAEGRWVDVKPEDVREGDEVLPYGVIRPGESEEWLPVIYPDANPEGRWEHRFRRWEPAQEGGV